MKRRGRIYSALAALAVIPSLIGCESPQPKPDILGDYGSIREKAVARLEASSQEDQLESLYFTPAGTTEDNGSFKVTQFGDTQDIISYNTNFIDVDRLKDSLQKHLEGLVQDYTISTDKDRNRIDLRVPRQQGEFYGALEGYLISQDSFPPIIKLEISAYRSFADWSEDIASALAIKPLDETGVQTNSNIPAAVLRAPERALIGGEYGLLAEWGSHIFDVVFDMLESSGFADEETSTTFYLISSREGQSSRDIEFPFKEEVLQGSVTVATTKYKVVPNNVTATATARGNDWVELNFNADLGEVTPIGAAQIPSVIQRGIQNQGILVRSGQSLISNSYENRNTFAVERSTPILRDIPFLGQAARGKDTETRADLLYVKITPTIVNAPSDPPEIEEK